MYNKDMNKIEEAIFKDREAAKLLYTNVVLGNKTAIKYKILDQASFDAIKKQRNEQIKDNKYPSAIEYTREYKGYKIDVMSCFGFNFYMINILKPEDRWKENDRYLIGQLTPEATYPSIYNKPFGIEYRDLIRTQEYIKFNLIESEKLDCADFEIEVNKNWPCYFFNKDSDEIICMSKEMEDKNTTLEKVEKL